MRLIFLHCNTIWYVRILGMLLLTFVFMMKILRPIVELPANWCYRSVYFYRYEIQSILWKNTSTFWYESVSYSLILFHYDLPWVKIQDLDFEEQDLFVQAFERLYGRRDYLRIWRANQVYHLYIFWNPICTHLICLYKFHGRYTRQILRFSLHRFQENVTIICYFELSLFDLKILRYTFVIWNQAILWSINWVMRN